MSLTLEHDPGQTWAVHWSGRHLLTYRYGGIKSYFHPVATSAGDVITVDAPWDHTWHRGLFFSWKSINGVNYWGEGLEDDAPWGLPRHRELTLEQPSSDCIESEQILAWEEHATGVVTLEETRRLRVSAPDAAGAYTIDWDATFVAQCDALLEPTQPVTPTRGGYAGLSFRPCRALHAGQTEAFNSEGGEGVDGVHGARARWAAFFGRVDGPGERGRRAGIVIMDHPDSLRHPTPYFVRIGATAGFLQAAPLFIETLRLAEGERVRMRHRVVVAEAQPSAAEIDAAWDAWVEGT